MIIALLVLGAVSLFINLAAILFMLFLLVQAIRDINGIKILTQLNTGKVAGIEKLVLSTHTFLMQDMLSSGPFAGHRPDQPPEWESMGVGRGEDGNFITEDGMHSAPTFDELMQKITQDPRYRVARPEDIDLLREQFEDYNAEHGEEFGPPTEGPIDGDEWKDPDGS